ncbi:MAG: putative quinol monooxygenase [Chloroflexota bacterium]|nr:putative quinol monooxygenase [Chloroflexota bacterium]
MYGLFGKMLAQPGQRDALIGHLLHAATLLREVDGCYLYVISSALDDPNGIWVNEVWRSQADHQASLTHDAIKSLITVARPLIAGFAERFEVTPLGGKGPSEIETP